MPDLTVSEFSYIAVSELKLKKRREAKVKNKGEYAHFRDYYLSLRNAIKSLFKKKQNFNSLREVVRKAHESKRENYHVVAENFISWATGKDIHHYDPPKAAYQFSKTTVTCNPELYYRINGQDCMLKLHFSGAEKMTQKRANIICLLMSESCEVAVELCRVLDLKLKKEYRFKGDENSQMNYVQQEIVRIEKEWDEL
ncbi:hypothetical protein E0X81_03105 [Halomonas sp. GDM18]|nr:hypothetical protein E0X81_03105 [Halomonas sp. GDM18]